MTASYRALALRLVALGFVLAAVPSEAYSNFNLGLSYNSGGGGYYGLPFGYGAAGQSFGAINGCVNSGIYGPGGIYGMGGGGMPMMPRMPQMPMMSRPMLAPPPQLVPPHMAMGGYNGIGMGGGGWMGGGMMPGGCMATCNPGFAQSSLVGPVPGGPMIQSGGREVAGGGIYSIASGGTTIIDMREREQEDPSANIVWSLGIGLGMQATNVFPMMPPRYAPTTPTLFYGDGERDSTFYARPHAEQ
jgi:hypothetical protein